MVMRTVLALSVGLIAAGATALAACSSDDKGTNSPVDDASTAKDAATSDHSAPGLDSSTIETDASAASDTGGGGVPDGGVPVTPNEVKCGATTCDTQTKTCCAAIDGGGTCMDGATATCPSGTGAIHCGESADCTGGNACCGAIDFQSQTASTDCAPACNNGFQFCGTSAECKNAQPCVVQTCFGQKLQICGKQGFCN